MSPAKMAAAPAPATKAALQEPGFWDRAGALARGYNTGGLIGGISDAVSGVDKAFDSRNQTAQFLVNRGISPTDATAMVSNPEILKTALPTLMGPKNQPQFTVIGEDAFGKKTYGWVNPANQTARPAQPEGTAGPSQLGNMSLAGDDYLKTLDPQIASQVKAIQEGRIPYPTGFALTKPYWQQMTRILMQADPGFDAVNYASRAKTRADLASGKLGQNLTSFNTTMAHLDTLEKSIDDLGNWSTMPIANSVINPAMAAMSGDFQARQKKFEVAKTAVIDELTRAFRGTGGNVYDLQEWGKSINSSDSPEALRAAIKQGVELLKGRIDAVGEQYNRGMGTSRDPVELLSPKAQSTFDRLISGKREAGQTGTAEGSPWMAPWHLRLRQLHLRIIAALRPQKHSAEVSRKIARSQKTPSA
jgi:hypothetical protein